MDGINEVLMGICRSDERDFTIRQLAMLVYLAGIPEEEGPQKAVFQAVARALSMSKPATTRAIQKFQKMGFLRSYMLERDQRQFWSVVTDKGLEFLRQSGIAVGVPAVGAPAPYLLVADPSTRAAQFVGPFATEDEAQRWHQAPRNAQLPGEVRCLVVAVAQLPTQPPGDEAKRLKAQRRLLPVAA